MKKIIFAGGDERMLFAAAEFAAGGFEAAAFGFDIYAGAYGKIEKAGEAELARADFAVLPPVVSRDGENLFAPFSEKPIALSGLDFGGARVFHGTACPRTFAGSTDYCSREAFAVRNAVPTAQGAVKIAMEETKQTVFGMRAAVLGGGRIARVLAGTLTALGAKTAVFARKSDARAWAAAQGAEAYDFRELCGRLGGFDCIFNTVPQKILGGRELASIKKGTPIIELASPPGCVGAVEAKGAGIRLVPAAGLPGRITPKTAGKIIYETITEIMAEEENR
ncbi:MAG: hypothetical protein IJW21_01970 [Clostridia bacterium]|nr:hypothetical protein [Clostridia bacterium]